MTTDTQIEDDLIDLVIKVTGKEREDFLNTYCRMNDTGEVFYWGTNYINGNYSLQLRANKELATFLKLKYDCG